MKQTASPFRWTFTRKDLVKLMAKLDQKQLVLAA